MSLGEMIEDFKPFIIGQEKVSPSDLSDDLLVNALSISSQSRHHQLSDILPYDPAEKSGERLKHGLNEFTLLLTALEEAMTALQNDEFARFDPLVGENACQIRAIKNALIFSQHPINSKALLKSFHKSRERLVEIWRDIKQLMKKGINLKKLLVQRALDVSLNYSELFLIQSYLLTKVKVLKTPREEIPFIKNEFTDTKKIKAMGSVGTMFAEALIKKLRESVSEASTQFIQELSKDLVLPNSSHEDYVSEKFLVRHRRLACLPCYWVTKILMLQALKNSIPIVMITQLMSKDRNYDVLKEAQFYYKATPQGYQRTEASTLDSNEPALILMGSSCKQEIDHSHILEWESELVNHCPMDLVLTYAASHRQYPDSSKDYLVTESGCSQYNYHKKRAEVLGCSIENPSCFFLSHAFCDTINNASQHMSYTDFQEKNLGSYQSAYV